MPQNILVSPNRDNTRVPWCQYVNVRAGHEDLGYSRVPIFSFVGLNILL